MMAVLHHPRYVRSELSAIATSTSSKITPNPQPLSGWGLGVEYVRQFHFALLLTEVFISPTNNKQKTLYYMLPQTNRVGAGGG